MKCSFCGKEIKDDAAFCGYCGKQMPSLEAEKGKPNDKPKRKHSGLKVLLVVALIALITGGTLGFLTIRGVISFESFLPGDDFKWTSLPTNKAETINSENSPDENEEDKTSESTDPIEDTSEKDDARVEQEVLVPTATPTILSETTPAEEHLHQEVVVPVTEPVNEYADDSSNIVDGSVIDDNNHETNDGTIETINVASGDTILFGSYEQDNILSNGSEPIEWIVLEVVGNRAFLVSKYALDAKPFNTHKQSNAWDSCWLRDWLNEEFFYQAFSEAERTRIAEINLEAEYNPVYGTKTENGSLDKVFLLSASEVERYFPDDSDKVCLATEYAKSQGAYTRGTYKKFDPETEEYYGCWWWLRTPGEERKWAAGVYSYVRSNRAPGESTIDYSGCTVWLTEYSVRPAMWITLES